MEGKTEGNLGGGVKEQEGRMEEWGMAGWVNARKEGRMEQEWNERKRKVETDSRA